MMESVASQMRSLLALAGLDPTADAVFPLRRIQGTRSGSGDIIFEVQNSECLAITFIDTDNVDQSAGSTLSISSSPNTTAYPAENLSAVIEVPTMYVFGPGTAVFTFTLIALPGTTAVPRVTGFILPQSALDKLRRLATLQIVTP